MLAVVVQLSALVFARTQAEAAASQAARRAAIPGMALDEIEQDLARIVEATVPGVDAVTATVVSTAGGSEAAVTIDWAPPGPDLLRLTFTVEAVSRSVDPP